MTIPPELETALLMLVEQGKGAYSWHRIAMRLASLDVPRSPDMMAALKELERRGWVHRHVTLGSPQDRWEITNVGRQRLDQEST